jgi:uncharacterized Fe-S center protein
MMNRRNFIKIAGISSVSVPFVSKLSMPLAAGETSRRQASSGTKVYFTRDISGRGLRKIYALVNKGISGKVAIKLHTGEPHGPYIIPREMVKELMTDIPNSTIVECNVFYDSPRKTTEGHRKVLETNGWTFSKVDIMDEDGDVYLPVPGGKWFKEIAMGKNMVNYDSMLVLTHFKGHTMGGFGGSLKNIAIGCASGKTGKKQLHQKGDEQWGFLGERFMENMVESGKATTAFFGPKMAFINVMNNLSVDCDCAGVKAAPPEAADVGILASTDILAVDQACVDMIYSLPEKQRQHLVERIESRKGLRQLSYMDEMRMGSRKYELVTMD